MAITCPHCQNPIKHVEDGAIEVTCPSCGKSFSVSKSPASKDHIKDTGAMGAVGAEDERGGASPPRSPAPQSVAETPRPLASTDDWICPDAVGLPTNADPGGQKQEMVIGVSEQAPLSGRRLTGRIGDYELSRSADSVTCAALGDLAAASDRKRAAKLARNARRPAKTRS